MSALTESLGLVMAAGGVRAAALVDVATGMVVQSAGRDDADPVAAVLLAEEVLAAQAAAGPDQPGGEVEEITLLTKGRMQMSRVLGVGPGSGLILFVDVDRTLINPALAALRLSQLAPAVLG